MKNMPIIDTLLEVPSETRTLEFKRLGEVKTEKILQSIAAMANTDGGLFVLGIDDPEKSQSKGLARIHGIEENLELYDEIGREIKNISPPISEVWPPLVISVPGKNVRIALISVPKVTDGLRSYNNKVYMRGEKGNILLTPQQIVHYAYVKGFKRADRELVEIDFRLLETEHYQSWRRKRGIAEGSVESILSKTGLARKNDQGKLLPTRAAVLLFAEYPNDLLDSKCTIRVLQYDGPSEEIKETLNLIGAPHTIHGPVLKQINDAHAYVLTLLRTGIRVPSGFVTSYQVPERAVKEAITNAVIHRDYYTKRDIEIKIFEDSVQIESPGLLPFNITPSNIGVERALGYRNDLLVKHLREFPDPPNLDQNEGVKAMRKDMQLADLYPPVFATYPTVKDGLRVILINEKAPTEWEKISHLLSTQKYIKNEDARTALKIEDTVAMSRLLSRWVQQGLLTKIVPSSGSKKNIKYRLPASDDKNIAGSSLFGS